MATGTIYRPGQTVPVSGIYSEVNSVGNYTGHRATCVEGEPFPPTSNNGYGWVLTTRTNP